MNVVTAAEPRRRFEMKTFLVTSENQVTALMPATDGSVQTAAAGETFGSSAELATLVAKWPASRVVAIWNGLPGVASVKKFTDRKTAIRRIWEKVQLLDASGAAETPAVTPNPRPAGKSPPRQAEGRYGPGKY
jgi:hypothetical protein